jgi:hypothetical protein
VRRHLTRLPILVCQRKPGPQVDGADQRPLLNFLFICDPPNTGPRPRGSSCLGPKVVFHPAQVGLATGGGASRRLVTKDVWRYRWR